MTKVISSIGSGRTKVLN